ncbi:MAG: LytR C-terminal domain-containing protein [Acidimicrobiia bacterium]|nr:LytR C-terminal domain-containing protein [Acidimicrobiia bacterium]
MAGKHEAPGTGEFWAGLIRHATMIVLGVGIVLALVFAVVKLLPEWFPADSPGPTDPIAAATSSTTSTTVDDTVQPVRTTVTPPTSSGSTSTTAVGSTSTTAAPTTTTSPTTTVGSERSPGEITVKVLNSTRTSGLAATVTADLAAAGYQMEEQGNYSPTQVDSFIYYAPGFQAEALTIQTLVAGTKVAANPAAAPSADILIILGTSFSG